MVKTPSRGKLKRFCIQWHKRLGIACALVVVLLASTGLLLNHSDQLGLPQQEISSPWILGAYHISPPSPVAFDTNAAPVAQLGERLFVDGREIGRCDGPLVGGVHLTDINLIACERSLALFTGDWQLIELMTAAYGVPVPINRLGLLGQQVVFESTGQFYLADAELNGWLPIEPREADLWSKPVELGAAESAVLLDHFESGISWERLILDLHAGRFFGSAGPFLLDFFAVGFLLLALSGTWLWVRGRPKAR